MRNVRLCPKLTQEASINWVNFPCRSALSTTVSPYRISNPSTFTMSETVYFIAGASRGIGLEFVKQLVKRPDAIVFAGVRTPSSLEKNFNPTPKNLIILKCDVTSDDDVSNCAKAVAESTYKKVDVLINNAGIDNFLPIRNTSPDQLQWVLETNLLAPLRVMKAFIPLMSMSSVKKIICISSDFGSLAMNDRKEFGAYNVSKAGLNMLVVQFKNEYAEEGIAFIPIHPGYVCRSS
jgi:NAD(P)-dependent dehydrogenase (short-subunit alcohol dehydrogenase family)